MLQILATKNTKNLLPRALAQSPAQYSTITRGLADTEPKFGLLSKSYGHTKLLYWWTTPLSPSHEAAEFGVITIWTLNSETSLKIRCHLLTKLSCKYFILTFRSLGFTAKNVSCVLHIFTPRFLDQVSRVHCLSMYE